MDRYLDIAKETFWDEDDDGEFEREREHFARRQREYLETGYWSDEED